MIGVQNLKEVFMVGAKSVKALSAAQADGKIDMADLQHLIPVGMALPDAVKDFDKVDDEIKDMSDEEAAEIRASVDAELGSGAYDRMGRHLLQAGLSLTAAYAAYEQRPTDDAE